MRILRPVAFRNHRQPRALIPMWQASSFLVRGNVFSVCSLFLFLQINFWSCCWRPWYSAAWVDSPGRWVSVSAWNTSCCPRPLPLGAQLGPISWLSFSPRCWGALWVWGPNTEFLTQASSPTSWTRISSAVPQKAGGARWPLPWRFWLSRSAGPGNQEVLVHSPAGVALSTEYWKPCSYMSPRLGPFIIIPVPTWWHGAPTPRAALPPVL